MTAWSCTAEEIGRRVSCRPVETDGAARAGACLAGTNEAIAFRAAADDAASLNDQIAALVRQA